MGLIRTELMPDSSEVVPYDQAGIPLYIRYDKHDFFLFHFPTLSFL